MSKRLKIALIIIITVVAILVGGFFIYVSDFYRADDLAIEVLQSDSEISIQDNYIMLSPAATSDTALIFYPGAKVDDFVKEAKGRFLEECDYLHEAHCQDRFVEIYKGHPSLVVPEVHGDYCSRRVLTTTFIEGKEFDEFLHEDVGYDKLGEVLKGVVVTPYAMTSLREYFATGFTEFYLYPDSHGYLQKTSPELYKKLVQLHRAD